MLKKKVIIVTPWFGEFAGGAETLAKTLAVEFNNRGIETVVFTTCCKSPYDDWWTDSIKEGRDTCYNNITTYRFSTNKDKSKYIDSVIKMNNKEKLTPEDKINFLTYGINSDNLVNELKKYVMDCQYEIIALPYYHALTHNIVNTYPTSISIIPCFHNEEVFYWENTQTLLKNCKYIFYNSNEEKKMTIAIHGRSVGKKLIVSPVSGVGIEQKKEYINGYSESALTLPDNYYLYIGRKEIGKNVHFLCQYFESYLKNINSDSNLVFIGGGDASIIPKNKNFYDFGFVSEKEKYKIISNCKGIINLSENESFSIVIMEGWLFKKPIIVSEKCNVTMDHVKLSNGGLYISNEHEFQMALSYLDDNKLHAEEMGKNGFKYVKNNFSHDNVINKYYSILKG